MYNGYNTLRGHYILLKIDVSAMIYHYKIFQTSKDGQNQVSIIRKLVDKATEGKLRGNPYYI